MNRLIKRIKRIQLVYDNKKIEEEYCSHQEPSNTQNSKFALYFIIFLLQIPTIPALINHHYIDAGIAGLLGIILFLIHFCKAFPKQYLQLFLGIGICSFNCCSLLHPSTSIETASKGDMFLQGYAVASINVILLVQLTTLTQKIVFLAYCYAFRFSLMFLLDPSTEQILAVISHLFIDLFVVFVSILNSKNKRLIFKKYYEAREDLDGIKDFLSNCFPHCFAVLDANAEKLLYANKTFSQTFLDMENESPLQLQSHLGLLSPGSKPMLKSLKVDISTIREVGDQFLTLDFAKQVELFENVLDKLNRHAILNKKAVSFSASYTLQDEQKSVEIILTKIKWSSQEAVVATFNDITYQQDIMRLKMQNAYKDRTIATVSHELRTPLNGILGILRLAEARIEDQQTLEYLELCKDNSNLLLSLVNSILDLHQIREGKLRTDPVALEVRKVLESVRKLFMFQCNQKGIELILNISDGAPRYMCTDENRLKQILINLIGNSIKFTSQGGVTIEVDQDPNSEEYLQISIVDTGIGIKEEDKGKLFQVYEKIEHGRSVNKNGVGLGLTIANTLAGILGGKKEGQMIEVESEVNKGSKFSFKILKDLEPLSERNENSMTKILKNCGKDSIEELNSQEEFYETPQIRKRTIGRLKSKINIPIQTETNSFISRLGSILMIDKTKSSNLLAATCNSSDPLETQKYPLNRIKTSRKILQIEVRGCILAVDDNPFNLLVVQTMAQEIGYTLKMTQSGQEAIEIMRLRSKDDAPFKAILMDCQMPLMDGFETTGKLRDMMKNGEVQNVPIIALTANTAEEDVKRCYEVGMMDHLSKPLDVNALHKAISGLVK